MVAGNFALVEDNFDDVYVKVVSNLLRHPQRISKNKDGVVLHEDLYSEFTVRDIYQCLAVSRPGFSVTYLQKEFAFYCSGSDKLEDAVKLSKFWNKCSDDGKTINSNYGKLLFWDTNSEGHTQLGYVVKCFKNNLATKKAVAVIYSKDHAYESKDNPCTMFLHFIIIGNRLYLKAHMRSNDVWYGIVYDVPFFCAVLHHVWKQVHAFAPDVVLGEYTHYACSLHAYQRDHAELNKMVTAAEQAKFNAKRADRPFVETSPAKAYQRDYIQSLFDMVDDAACGRTFTLPLPAMSIGMKAAHMARKKSTCLKKKCGAALVYFGKGFPSLLGSAHNGRNKDEKCPYCVRDSESPLDKYYGDSCPAVHAEMRLLTELTLQHSEGATITAFQLADGRLVDKKDLVVYTTHGPCDACLKLIDLYGITNVVYDIPYKTNYDHWPRIKVRREAVTPEDVEPGKHAEHKEEANSKEEVVVLYNPEVPKPCF